MTWIYFHSSFEAWIIPPCVLHTSGAHSIIHSCWNISILGLNSRGMRSTRSTSLCLSFYVSYSCGSQKESDKNICYIQLSWLHGTTSRLPRYFTSILVGFIYSLNNLVFWLCFYVHANKQRVICSSARAYTNVGEQKGAHLGYMFVICVSVWLWKTVKG